MKPKTVQPGDYDSFVRVIRGEFEGLVGYYDDDEISEEWAAISEDFERNEDGSLADKAAEAMAEESLCAVVYFGTPLLSGYEIIPYEDLVYASDEEAGAYYRKHMRGKLKNLQEVGISTPAGRAAPARQVGSVVYFIQSGEQGPIKIGVTGNVERRLAGLQTAHHEDLRLLATTPGDVETERELHERFAAARLRGEWFRPTEELLRFIETLEAP